MAVWIDEIVSEERLLHPGHAACAGCGPAINVRHVLDGLAAAKPESRIVLVIPASCWTIIAGIWPVNAFGVTVHLTPFASAAADANSVRETVTPKALTGQAPAMIVQHDAGMTRTIFRSGVAAWRAPRKWRMLIAGPQPAHAA